MRERERPEMAASNIPRPRGCEFETRMMPHVVSERSDIIINDSNRRFAEGKDTYIYVDLAELIFLSM